ncbi:MAG: FAD-binding oxidoreductase, partial [Halobacteriovoraceae bacterium]|nr:FAD-binding oxidoreductase [Halobacteriovoraceae bacterium]
MSVSFWQDIGMTKQVTSKFDITIIGGGIAGLSCAYWLLKEDKGLRVALVEKNQIGAGASGRNAGFITCGSVEHFNRLVSTHGESQALEIWNFSETNLMLLKSELLSVNPEECDFEQKGSFSLASTEQEYQELKQTYVCMQKLNIEVEQLNQSEIKKCLGVDHFVGGIKYIKDAAINPMKLLQKLKKSLLLNYNFSLYENHEVFDIQTQGDSKVVKANNNYLSSSAVIMATNGYLPLFDDYFKDKIFPTKGQILTTTSVPQFMLGPCYANFVL